MSYSQYNKIPKNLDKSDNKYTLLIDYKLLFITILILSSISFFVLNTSSFERYETVRGLIVENNQVKNEKSIIVTANKLPVNDWNIKEPSSRVGNIISLGKVTRADNSKDLNNSNLMQIQNPNKTKKSSQFLGDNKLESEYTLFDDLNHYHTNASLSLNNSSNIHVNQSGLTSLSDLVNRDAFEQFKQSFDSNFVDNQSGEVDKRNIDNEFAISNDKVVLLDKINRLKIIQGYNSQGNKTLNNVLNNKPSELVVELILPERLFKSLRRGDNVKIKLDAFPHEQFGVIESQIGRVNAIVLASTAVSELSPKNFTSPVEFSGPIYKVQVKLNQRNIHAYGASFNLQSGMQLNADIMLDKKSFLASWF